MAAIGRRAIEKTIIRLVGSRVFSHSLGHEDPFPETERPVWVQLRNLRRGARELARRAVSRRSRDDDVTATVDPKRTFGDAAPLDVITDSSFPAPISHNLHGERHPCLIRGRERAADTDWRFLNELKRELKA